jgi:hypothetical protein
MTAGHPLATEPGQPSHDVHEETSPWCAGGRYRRHSNAIDVTPRGESSLTPPHNSPTAGARAAILFNPECMANVAGRKVTG